MATNTNPSHTSDTRSAYALWAIAAAVMILLLAYGTYHLYEPAHYNETPPTQVITND